VTFFGNLPGDVTDEAGERNKKEIPFFHPIFSPRLLVARLFNVVCRPEHTISGVLRVREWRFL
jgi:hypothetical protein